MFLYPLSVLIANAMEHHLLSFMHLKICDLKIKMYKTTIWWILLRIKMLLKMNEKSAVIKRSGLSWITAEYVVGITKHLISVVTCRPMLYYTKHGLRSVRYSVKQVKVSDAMWQPSCFCFINCLFVHCFNQSQLQSLWN